MDNKVNFYAHAGNKEGYYYIFLIHNFLKIFTWCDCVVLLLPRLAAPLEFINLGTEPSVMFKTLSGFCTAICDEPGTSKVEER